MNNINYSSYSHHNGEQDEAAVVLVTSAKKGDIYRRGSAANLLFLETLQKTHASFVVEMQDADIKSAIRFAKKKIGKPITALAILGHGNPDLIQLADGNEGLYRIENVRAQDFRDLSRNAFIYLGSCHSANFAKTITLKTGLVTAASFASVSVGLSFLIPRMGRFEFFTFGPGATPIGVGYSFSGNKTAHSEGCVKEFIPPYTWGLGELEKSAKGGSKLASLLLAENRVNQGLQEGQTVFLQSVYAIYKAYLTQELPAKIAFEKMMKADPKAGLCMLGYSLLQSFSLEEQESNKAKGIKFLKEASKQGFSLASDLLKHVEITARP